jgi:hypothetical protein
LLAFAAFNKVDVEVEILVPFWVQTAVDYPRLVFTLEGDRLQWQAGCEPGAR